jgi:hypothetical protein
VIEKQSGGPFFKMGSPAKTGAHKEVFAIALLTENHKCYGASIDNVTALMYNYY